MGKEQDPHYVRMAYDIIMTTVQYYSTCTLYVICTVTTNINEWEAHYMNA